LNSEFSPISNKCTGSLQFSGSTGNSFNKTQWSLDANTVNILVCLRSWLSIDIWVRKRSCYLLILLKFLGKVSHFGQYM